MPQDVAKVKESYTGAVSARAAGAAEGGAGGGGRSRLRSRGMPNSCEGMAAMLDLALKGSQGLLTPLIAIIVAWIAWQQLAANREKLKLDKYERRFKVYAALTAFVGAVTIHANMKDEDLVRFLRETAEADFLFGDDDIIRNYLRKVRNVAHSVATANAEYRDYTQDCPPGYDHKQIVQTKYDALRWLADQDEEARKLFKPYMELDK